MICLYVEENVFKVIRPLGREKLCGSEEGETKKKAKQITSFFCFVCSSHVNLSPDVIILSLQFFMDDCLEKLVDRIESGDLNLKDIILSERLSKLLRLRLELQAQYISKWAQALSIQVSPFPIFLYTQLTSFRNYI